MKSAKYIIGSSLLIAGMIFSWNAPRAMTAQQGSQTIQSTTVKQMQIPTVEDLFGDLEMPYDGLGAVSIGVGGLVIIQAEADEGTAFFANLEGLSLVERDGEVSLQKSTLTGESIHHFEAVEREVASRQSAACDIPGYLMFDYDEECGSLYVEVDGAAQRFQATFSFAGAQVIPPPAPLPKGQETSQSLADGKCTCECHLNESGHHCDACNRCPAGFICTCVCQYKKSGNSESTLCRCTTCKMPKVSGVTIEQSP